MRRLNTSEQSSRPCARPPAELTRATPAATSHSFLGQRVQVASASPAATSANFVRNRPYWAHNERGGLETSPVTALRLSPTCQNGSASEVFFGTLHGHVVRCTAHQTTQNRRNSSRVIGFVDAARDGVSRPDPPDRNAPLRDAVDEFPECRPAGQQSKRETSPRRLRSSALSSESQPSPSQCKFFAKDAVPRRGLLHLKRAAAGRLL